MSQEKTLPPLPLESSAEAKLQKPKNEPLEGTVKKGAGPRKINMVGRKYGRWTIISFFDHRPKRMVRWLCKCDCGNEKVVEGAQIRRGASLSCGCIRSEMLSVRATKHGHTGSRTYICWMNMKARCYNKDNIGFMNYGGRGITVCKRWLASFENFIADMGEVPDGMSIDRRENDGNYEPDNCRWATKIIQQNNCSTNHIVTLQGITDTIANHARRMGLKYMTLFKRINKLHL